MMTYAAMRVAMVTPGRQVTDSNNPVIALTLVNSVADAAAGLSTKSEDRYPPKNRRIRVGAAVQIRKSTFTNDAASPFPMQMHKFE